MMHAFRDARMEEEFPNWGGLQPAAARSAFDDLTAYLNQPIAMAARSFEPPATGDGPRVLVDRIWPRGVSKERAAIDRWLKDVAPSARLRGWFGHDSKKWGTFVAQYRAELRTHPQALRTLRELVRHHRTTTLLYAARDVEHNNAVALRRILRA